MLRNPWDDDPLVEQPQGGMTMQIRPADPMRPYQVEQARNDAARSGNQANASEFDPAIAQANLERIRAETERERLATERLRLEAEQGSREDRARLTTLDSLTQQLVDVERQFRQNVQGGAPWWLGGVLPTSDNAQFNRAGEQLLDVGQNVFRVPGSGGQDQREFEAKRRAYVPSTWNTDADNQQIINYLRMRIDTERRAAGQPAVDWENLVNPAQPNMPGTGSIDRSTQRSMSPPEQQPQTVSDGATDLQEDPILRGIAGRLGPMISAGRPDREILQVLRDAGIPPEQTSVGEVLQFRRTPAFRQWRQQNPGQPYPFSDNFWMRSVPRPTGTLSDSLRNSANSPGGAAAIMAGNAITGNRYDDIAALTGENQDQIRAGLAGLREQNPVSSFIGDVGGTMLAYGAGGSAASRIPANVLSRLRSLPGVANAGPGARMMAGDALYGAYAGSGDDNLLAGTALNVAGGMAGRAIPRVGGAVIGGTRDAAIRYATDRGIPLTLGSMAGQGGIVGRIARGIENRAAGMPGIGDFIGGQYRYGVESGARAAHQEALDQIGGRAGDQLGEAAVDSTLGQIQGAFRDALRGVNLSRDRAFSRQMTGVARSAARPAVTSEVREVTNAALAQVDELFSGRNLSGQNFHAALQIIDDARAAVQQLPAGQAGAQTLRQAERALLGMARRQAPNMVPALNRARAAYRRFASVRDATRAATNDAEGVFTPAQLGTAVRSNTTQYGGRNASASTNRPFFELQDAMRQLLPNRVPDSGTGGRLAAAGAGAALLGGGVATDQLGITDDASRNIALGLGAVAAPYTNVGRSLIQSAVARRPSALREFGGRVQDEELLRRYIGRLGAAALPYQYEGY